MAKVEKEDLMMKDEIADLYTDIIFFVFDGNFDRNFVCVKSSVPCPQTHSYLPRDCGELFPRNFQSTLFVIKGL